MFSRIIIVRDVCQTWKYRPSIVDVFDSWIRGGWIEWNEIPLALYQMIFRSLLLSILLSIQLLLSHVPQYTITENFWNPIQLGVKCAEIGIRSCSYGRVGERIYHVWQCDKGAQGFFVHSCFVTDGHGNRFDLVHFLLSYNCFISLWKPLNICFN